MKIIENVDVPSLLELCYSLEIVEESVEGRLNDNYFIRNEGTINIGTRKPKFIVILEQGLNDWSSDSNVYGVNSEKEYKKLMTDYVPLD